jgi:CubicO group peptidase (beta-lactamase class C family)
MKKILCTALLVSYLLVIHNIAAAQKKRSTDRNLLQQQVDTLFINSGNIHRPGAAVAIVRNGKVLYKKGYGYANLENDVPITPATVFHIASLSKQFTALSVLLLVKDGKLSLNDNINKYLPEMPVFDKPITILNLLHHTSGLREWIYLMGLQGYKLTDMFTQEQIIILSHQKDLNFDPGAEFMYVNSGYILLSEIVARTSGMPFAEFVRQRIFTPLDMSHSSVSDDYESIVKKEASSYASDGKNGFKKKLLNSVNIVGSTGVLTTVEDLSKWTENFENPKVGDVALFKQMKQREILNNGDTTSYAMGQFIGNYKSLLTIDHSGSDAGFRTYLLRFPEKKLSIIVLANDASIDAGSLAYQIADIYLNYNLKKVPVIAVKKSPTSIQSSIKTATKELSSYIGRYEVQKGLIMDFKLENNDLVVNATGQGKFKLQQTAPDIFKMIGVNGIVSFLKNNVGELDRIGFEINGKKMQGTRIKDKQIDSESMMPYTGQFYSKELNITYNITYANGKLTAKNNRATDTQLSLISADSFSGDQWFMGIVKFFRNDKQFVTGLTVSTDRVKNLVFNKNVNNF